MPAPALILAPPPTVSARPGVSIAHGRAAAAPSPFVARWFLLALGSLLLAGLLSLSVVLGRLPFLSGLIDDPLFFKRCLVVHVDLALVVWFYAFASALAALRAGPRGGAVSSLSYVLSALGVAGVIGGGLMRGAAPVLANYVPVIDHPLFLAGLACFFLGVLGFSLRHLLAPSAAHRILPPDAGIGVQACGIALALAAVSWVSARAALPPGLPAHTFFEFSHWGPGHVLQAANVCAMLSVWLWAAGRVAGRPVLPGRGAGLLFSALLLPHFAMPLLSWRGALHRTYVEGATALMRWGIFPVVLLALALVARHLRRHASPGISFSSENKVLRAGLAASVGLTLLGFILGACIRSSTTLVPAHYHASLGGVTAAFMTASFLLLKALGRIETLPRAAAAQLACFGAGQAVFALGFAIGGAYGLGRKTYAAEQHVRTLGEQIGLGVMGLGGLAAAAAGVWFLVLVIRPLLARRAPAAPTPISVHP